MKTDKKFIYLLKDPRNDDNKYVGSSNNPEKRLRDHLSKSKREHTKKGNWIKSLIKNNLKPILVILKETNQLEYQYWEEFYIKKLKDEGSNLLNYDDKGIGTAYGSSKETIEKITKLKSILIYQYNLCGQLINIFPSLREAERLTNINHGNISKCCSGIYNHTGGYIFKKTKDEIIEKIINPNATKKIVLEIDDNGYLINEYNSIADAAKKTNSNASNISRVCNGKLKKTNNKKFKFKENGRSDE